VHLLTGAGGGVMAAVSRAFVETPGRQGLAIGIVPSDTGSTSPKPGYPNRWIELPIYTHLPLSGRQGTHAASRNHINILTSDVIVALPGGPGTASEAALALDYARPIIAFLGDGSEITDLSPAITVASDLSAVQAFVTAALRSARR
jgi:uncharacterized protein (TIGR00725 family)